MLFQKVTCGCARNSESYDDIIARPAASIHQAYCDWCTKIAFTDSGGVSNEVKRGYIESDKPCEMKVL